MPEHEPIRQENQEPIEQKATREDSFEQAVHGAEILENPPDGGFFHGLQVFLSWVNQLLGKNKQD